MEQSQKEPYQQPLLIKHESLVDITEGTIKLDDKLLIEVSPKNLIEVEI